MQRWMNAGRVRAMVEASRERHEGLLRAGQTTTWQCDQRTRDIWCIGHVIDERFEGLQPERRRELGWAFSRMVRSTEDPFEAAAKVIDVGDNGSDIGEVSKDHWTAKNHRKWG